MSDYQLGEHLYLYKSKAYPNYLKSGNACKYILPCAQEFCKGVGLDIGGTPDAHFPGATLINTIQHDEYDAYNLPCQLYDYIFSSHTLEHLAHFVGALKYWQEHLKEHAVLFLYLPHPDMEYWLPQNNKKHEHWFYPKEIEKVLRDIGFKYVIRSERDLYWSFSVVAIKH